LLLDDENKRSELMTPRDRLFLRALEAVRSGTPELERAPRSGDELEQMMEEPFTPVEPPTMRFTSSGASIELSP
jgi:hypothetical protein